MAQLPFFKVGDFGQTIRRIIVDEKNDPVDVSAANVAGEILFKFHDPDGNLTSKNGTFTTNGEDGQVEYVVESALFDAEGDWVLQITVADAAPATFQLSTAQEDLTVSPVIT